MHYCWPLGVGCGTESLFIPAYSLIRSYLVKHSTMLRRLQGESDIGFYGDDSSDGGPYEKDISTNPPPAPAEYDSPGYRDTYDYTSAASIPLSPWCIAYYVILPSFALFGLVVAIYYWRCCPWLCCYRDDDDNAWRDRSKKVRSDSERTEGTAENPSAKKSNGVPTSIAIAIPEGFVEPQQQHMERETLPVAKEVPSGRRGWMRMKKDVTPPPLKKDGILHDQNSDAA